MRYVYKEPVIRTVSDSEVSETKEIKDILASFKQNEQSIGIEFHDPEFPDSIKVLDNVRVTDVGEESCDLHAFFSHSSARYRKVPFHHIKKVLLVANKAIISK